MVHIDCSTLRETRWYEYAVQFIFGGLITAATGIIAKKFGPAIGGLFLAFPAIFPATATLLEKHVKEKKERAGLSGNKRALDAASLDAAGAALGSVGLVAFASFVWRFMPDHKAYLVLAGAAVTWFALSGAAWEMRRTWHRFNH